MKQPLLYAILKWKIKIFELKIHSLFRILKEHNMMTVKIKLYFWGITIF